MTLSEKFKKIKNALSETIKSFKPLQYTQKPAVPFKVLGQEITSKDIDLLAEAVYGEANPDEKEIKDIASIALNRALEQTGEFGKIGQHGGTAVESVLQKPFAFESITGDQKDSGLRQRVQKLREFKLDPQNNPLPPADLKQYERVRSIVANMAMGRMGTTTSDLFFKHKESDKSLFTTRDYNELLKEM